MDIRNDTPFEDGLSIGLGPNRHPCISVIIKGTFVLPRILDGPVEVATDQIPFVTADEYYNGDVTGNVRLETDNAVFKPRADIVLVGKAYTPGGQPAKTVDVLLRVGETCKIIRVFGDRQWLFPSRMVMVPVISAPEPFIEMPLLYERAYGGFDHKASKWCDKNLSGLGFIGRKSRDSVHEQQLPNLEDSANLIKSWDDTPDPVGFGFYDRNWQPRAGYAGTPEGLTQADETFGLASDFQHDFYNSAHPDLQVTGYLHGNENVELINVTTDKQRRFNLPGIRPEITVDAGRQSGAEEEEVTEPTSQEQPLDVHLDTLVFLPDEDIFFQVWRGLFPLNTLDDVKNIRTIQIQETNI